MNVNRKQLHDLIDAVDTSEFDVLYQIIIKFIPEDFPVIDEVEALRTGEEEIERGEYIKHEDIDWGTG